MNAILQGRSILIVEDEPLIAMEIVRAFESAGACVLKTSTLHQALVLVEGDLFGRDVGFHEWGS